MFGFLNRSGTSNATAAIQQALAGSDLPAGLDLAGLGVVESRGSYSGRKVTYFRVFDPRQTEGRVGRSGKRLRYEDLEAHRDLVLRSGHIERDGTVMLNRVLADEAAPQPSSTGPARSGRAPADRSAHPDDNRFIDREVAS